MRGSVHEVISLSARFPLCATAAWPGSPMLAFHKVLWSRPTLPRLALCATAAWPGSPMLAFHKLLWFTVTPQPAILSELLCILGAEGCAVDVFRRPAMQIFLN
jgi:hypothetical protein